MEKIVLQLNGLDCAHCAEKIRDAVEKLVGIEKAEMNFMSKKLYVTAAPDIKKDLVYDNIIGTIKNIEPDVEPVELGAKPAAGTVLLILEGLDCAECGEKIRSYAEAMNSVEKAELNFLTKKLTLVTAPSADEKRVIFTLENFIRAIEPDVKVISGQAALDYKAERPAEENEISRLMTARLAVTAVLFAVGLILREGPYAMWIFLAAYAVIGTEIVAKAAANILKGRAMDECFLMTVATVGAFIIGEYPEGVAVMFLYQLGEMFQSFAVRRSRKSISQLMDIRPDSANVKNHDEIVTCHPEAVSVDDIIVIKPGEKVPLDAEIISGSTTVDSSALTGESVPVKAEKGDVVLSGSVNVSGLIEARVIKEYGESTAAKILELVENSAAKKAKTENFITRFAKVYTPCVVGAAVLLAVVPMIIEGGFSSEWLYKALSFLVVSCPCALVISVPLSFFGGIGGASAKGILVKGGSSLETLAKCRRVVFDKTGTLTTGTFSVTEISAVNMSEDELLKLAAYAESVSNHPVAQSVMKRWGKEVPSDISAEEIAGKGVKAEVSGKVILAGSVKLMDENGIRDVPSVKGAGTVVYVACDGVYAGYIRISDTVKKDSAAAVGQLKKSGIETVMLTGDRKEAAEAIASEMGVDSFKAELLPGDKVTELEKLMADGKITAFTGDGINDAPVLMRSDVGIAMGGIGSDAAIEAADVVLMTDEPSKINEAIKIAKKTKSIVTQNIVFSLGVKGIILILTALGFTTMWIAVFGDVGVAVIAVLNAMRARK
ncbi:MAG: cadmium-translocating P-type ATPase [Oscillospiraceae bacterium]|nr:cadmium-translocating P-type ATPase [Oscillospiraceae bacterium]